jgi:hypothetical protein
MSSRNSYNSYNSLNSFTKPKPIYPSYNNSHSNNGQEEKFIHGNSRPLQVTLAPQPMNHSQEPPIVVDHLEESVKFLRARGYMNLELTGSFASYMTGLQYHNHAKPQNQYIYICNSDPNNKYDSNAIGVYDDQQKRLAYVPKHLAKHITDKIRVHMDSGEVKSCVLVAFCCSNGTSKSAQCIYNLYVNLKPATATMEYSVGEKCVYCSALTSGWLSCGHHPACDSCVNLYSPCRCPSCHQVVG